MPLGRLFVEGVNDLHLLRNLLQLHGIDVRAKPAQQDNVEIVDKNGFDEMVRAVDPEVKSRAYPLGFVADADPAFGLQRRWEALTNPMRAYLTGVPSSMPPGGWVHSGAQVGVWLMPDNRIEGTIEDFMRLLVLSGTALWDHAVDSTEGSMEKGSRFREADRRKAEAHAWLAWQDPPGLRYGEAISRGCMDANAELAQQFVQWFRSLYSL